MITNTLTHKPCLVPNVARHFAINTFTILASIHYMKLARIIMKCIESQKAGQSKLKGRVVQIIGDEHTISNLKLSLIQSRRSRVNCYLLLCSSECRSLLLFLSVMLEIDSFKNIWIIYNRNMLASQIHVPWNMLSIDLSKRSKLKNGTSCNESLQHMQNGRFVVSHFFHNFIVFDENLTISI